MESVTCPIVQGFTGMATITHVQGEDKWLRLWVHTNQKTIQTIQHFLLELTPHLDSERGFLHQCQVPLQSKVFARSIHDNKWHRGLVISWPPGNNVRDVAVQLFDYGRTELIDGNSVRRMDEIQFQRISSIPAAATECWLADAWPVISEWPKAAIDIAVNFVNSSNPVRISGVGHVEGKPLIQVFSETPPMNLSNILIQQGFAIRPITQQPSPPFQHVSPPYAQPLTIPPVINRMVIPTPLQQPEQIRYTCTNLELGSSHRVHVSHVEGPHLFFIQLVKRDGERFILSQQIAAHVTSNPTALKSLTQRTPCLAYLARDSAYARALILQPTGDGVSFTVHFVDVGCSEKHNYASLLDIPPELSTEFVLAYECQLGVVLPDPAMMPQMVVGKVFDCHVLHKNGSRLVVSLNYQGKDISELCRQVALVRAMTPPQPTPILRYRIINIPREYRYNVVVTFINSPRDLYAQLLDNAKQIDDQLNAMTAHYSNNPMLFPEVTESQCFVGQTVVVQFTSDDSWYRGEVIQSPKDGNVDILYVDFGNTQTVPVRQLRRLLPVFSELPKQALRLCLSGFENVSLTPKDIENFENQVLNKEFLMEINDSSIERYTVTLLSGPNNQPLNQQFLNATSKATVAAPQVEQIEKVFVTVFNSAGDFSGQLAKFGEEQFSVFSDQLHTYYEALPPLGRIPFQVGDMVATKYLDSFYRARIMNLLSPKAEVLFVDFGNKETVIEAEMFPLSARFSQLQQQSINCRFVSEDVGKLPKAKLEELIFNQTVELRVLGLLGDKYQVELSRAPENAAVLREVDSLAAKVSFQKPNIKIGFRCEVVVTDVMSNGRICCQLQGQTDQLTAMMENLEQYYQKLGPQDQLLKNVSVGSACVAKFSEDESWYRAKVLALQGPRNLKVVFVDYGNSEDTQASGVKILAPQFSTLPYQAVEFVLVCTPNSFWNNENVQKAKTFFTEKFSSLMAHVHGEKPALEAYEVDLLDEQGNNIGQQFVKEQTKAAPVPVASTQAYAKAQSAPVVSDEWNEEPNAGLTNGGANFGKRDNFNRADSNTRDNFKNNNSFLSRNDSSTDTFDKPRGRFGGFDDPEDKPQGRFGGRDNSDGSKGRFGGNDDGGFKSRDNNRFDSNSRGQRFGDRENKSWENKDDSRNNYQKRDNFNNDSSQSFGPKSKVDSPVKPKLEVKPFGTFLEVKPMSCADVSVEHVVSPGEFYCHLVENSDAFLTLLESMDDCYSKGQGLPLQGMNKGSVCCAQSAEDSAWYRARVQETKGTTVDVLFVDYGNTENVPQTKVKELKKEFHPLPIQAIKCSLANLIPEASDWHPDDVATFQDTLLNQTMVVRFRKCLGEGSYQIQIIEAPGSIDIVKNLKHVKTATENDPLGKRNFAIGAKLQSLLPEAGSSETVQITWVIKPNVLKCQRQSLADPFKKMMDAMQTFYNELPDGIGLVEKPKMGMHCVVQFTEDDAWYRACVKKVRGGKVEVYYVDYGNSEEVTRHRVRYLAGDFSSAPCHAIECRLQGVRAVKDLSPGSGEHFFEGDFACSFSEQVGNAITVKLKNSTGKDLAAELVAAGICAFGDESESGPYPLPKPSSESLAVYVSHVDSVDSVFVQLSSQEEDLTKLSDKLLEQTSTCAGLKDPEVGGACCAMDTDEAYYRAVITAIEGNQAVVRFVDFGNSNTVTSSTLLNPPAALLSQAPFALHCSLGGIATCQGSEVDATAFLTELTADKTLTANVKAGGRAGAPFSVTLSDEEGDLKQRLLDSGHFKEYVAPSPVVAPKIPASVAKFPSRIIPTTPEACYVSTALSIKELYVQLASEEEALLTLAEGLNASYAVSAQLLQDPVVGGACCSLYSEDGAWYRAQVSSIQDGKATVLFVDYGNSEVVDISSLKVANADALSVPPYAIRCRFGLLAPVAGKEQEALEQFTSLTTDKQLTATFSAVGQDITVALSTEEDGNLVSKMDSALVVEEIPPKDLVSTSVFKFASTVIPTEPQVCYTSTVASLKSVFLQLANQEEALTTLAEGLNAAYADGGEPLPNPVVGAACCALYSEDGAWYRAQIVSIQDGKATVLFVDYGNSEVVDISLLKKASDDALSIAPFAIECHLDHLAPSVGKEKEALDLLTSLTDEKELTGTFSKDPECMRVALITVEDGDLAAKLLESGFAIIEEVIVPSQTLDSICLTKFPDPTIPTEPLTCYISSASSLKNIFLQLTIQEEALTTLASDLNTSYASGGQPLPNPAIGAACCALYSVDEAWYRAQIVSIENEKATVLFVDYGNCEEVETVTLKIPDANALSVAPFALECRLGRLAPSAGKEAEALDLFTSLTTDKEVTASFHKDSHCLRVSLSTDDDGDFSTKLLDSGLAVLEEEVLVPESHAVLESEVHLQTDTGTVTNDVAVPQEEVVVLEKDVAGPEEAIVTLEKDVAIVEEQVLVLEKDTAVPQESSVLLEKKILESATPVTDYEDDLPVLPEPVVPSEAQACFVSSCEAGPTKFYLQLTNRSEELEILAAQLFETYEEGTGGAPLDNPKLGDLCCSQYSIDGSWYRSRIVSLEGNSVEVVFIDYGNGETVSKDSLQTLNAPLRLQAPFALVCSLKDIAVSPDQEAAAQKAFEDLTMEQELSATFHGTKSLAVTLKRADGDVLEQLVQSGVCSSVSLPVEESQKDVLPSDKQEAALPDMASPVSLPGWTLPTEEQSCYIPVTGDGASRFFLQLACQESSLLELQTLLEETYGPSADVAPVGEPTIGGYCAALFQEDQQWYRGRILGVHENKVTVLFVDYGNKEVLPREFSRTLNPEFLFQAPFALECSLGLSSAPGSEELCAQVFLDLTKDKDLTVTFEQCGKATDTLNPPFKVKLMDQDGDLTQRLLDAGLVRDSSHSDAESVTSSADLPECSPAGLAAEETDADTAAL